MYATLIVPLCRVCILPDNPYCYPAAGNHDHHGGQHFQKFVWRNNGISTERKSGWIIRPQNEVDTKRERMEGIAISELRQLLEESSQHRFTVDLHEGKQYPVLRFGSVSKPLWTTRWSGHLYLLQDPKNCRSYWRETFTYWDIPVSCYHATDKFKHCRPIN
jgi:hypothetical protein